jgi:hypothetical protein
MQLETECDFSYNFVNEKWVKNFLPTVNEKWKSKNFYRRRKFVLPVKILFFIYEQHQFPPILYIISRPEISCLSGVLLIVDFVAWSFRYFSSWKYDLMVFLYVFKPHTQTNGSFAPFVWMESEIAWILISITDITK